ncbi:hypothetical protein ADK70_31855 [Streptomyces rimosus subsp. pseudoverticillatus]|nr:hypothetical protein ADK70_31855 [Streptomyces rimosus subsp. pseudoverticillatus]
MLAQDTKSVPVVRQQAAGDRGCGACAIGGDGDAVGFGHLVEEVGAEVGRRCEGCNEELIAAQRPVDDVQPLPIGPFHHDLVFQDEFVYGLEGRAAAPDLLAVTELLVVRGMATVPVMPVTGQVMGEMASEVGEIGAGLGHGLLGGAGTAASACVRGTRWLDGEGRGDATERAGSLGVRGLRGCGESP